MLRSTLFDKIQKAARRETVVSLVDGKTVTGGQLLHVVEHVTAYLHGLGAGPQSRIMAILPNGLAQLVLYLSCLRYRMIICPVSPDSPQQDINYIRSVFRPDAVVDPAALQNCLDTAFDGETSGELPAPAAGTGYEDDDIFSVNFTSGTTGKPKGVAHLAERMLANAQAFNVQMGCDETQRMMHVMPMYYMAGLLNTILCPLMAGGAVIVGPALLPRTALTFWRELVDNRVTAFWLSPTMLRMVMKLDRTKDSRDYAAREIRHAFVGTAPMPLALGQDFLDRYDVRPLQSYGLSELLLVACDSPASDEFGSVGRLLEGVSGGLSGDQELELKTAYLFAGYLNPETGEIDWVDRQEAFKTGDLAEFDDRSRLRITGRKKDLIVVGGINVSPAAIEERLQSVSGVIEVAVVGESDDVYGEVPVAFVQIEKSAEEPQVLGDLRASAQSELPAASRPVRFYPVDTMPTGPTGKVQKRLLVRPGSS